MNSVENLIYSIFEAKGHFLKPGILAVFVSPNSTAYEAIKKFKFLTNDNVEFFYTSDSQLNNIMVMRRPLLTSTYPAYVAADFTKFSHNDLYERIADVLANDVPKVELLSSPCGLSYSITEPCHSAPPPCSYHYNIPPHKPEPDYNSPADAGVQFDEEEEEDTIEFDRKQFVDRLSAMVLDYVNRYHEMPPLDEISTLISGKISLASHGMSPVVVNGDLKVILPDFNELEIRLTPLARTVYILFLKHPEGIVLKDIGIYKDELEEIYSLVRPGADPELARTYINELTVPGSDSLRQKLSMIKRGVNNALINKNVAAHYHVIGARGERYHISGFPTLEVKLPRILT